VAVLTAPDRAEDRARSIGFQIRCPVCQGESIADSPSQTARDMMDLIRQRISEGLADEQILDELVSSYSGALLLDPPLAGATLWLWLVPPLALVTGIFVVARRFRTKSEGGVPSTLAEGRARFGGRTLTGALALGLVMAAALVAVGQFRQARAEDQSLPGISAGAVDPENVSNETMEAVIAANLDNPEINGMRLALANRYFEEGDYQGAFPHYQAVLEGEPSPGQAAAAYSRLGWMVFDGNGEVELAVSLLDQALTLVPEDPFGLYLKGRVVWCGQDRPAEAATLFERVVTIDGLDAEVKGQVEADLAAAAAGQRCP
jgi:cytochrome c-type biogenesis protein CcmH/NrfF